MHDFDLFSEYGQSCKDIGCLPSEKCKMSFTTCGFKDQDGENCGQFPTCKRKASRAGLGKQNTTNSILLIK